MKRKNIDVKERINFINPHKQKNMAVNLLSFARKVLIEFSKRKKLSYPQMSANRSFFCGVKFLMRFNANTWNINVPHNGNGQGKRGNKAQSEIIVWEKI